MLSDYNSDPATKPESRPASSQPVEQPQPTTEASMRWAYAALGLLAGLAFAFGIWAMWPDDEPQQLTQGDIDLAVQQALDRRTTEPPASTLIFDQIAPSLVVVTVPDQGDTIGSGIVVNRSGQVMTAWHVVSDATEIELTFADGSTSPAVVVSSEPASDIAVLEATTSVGPFAAAVLGDARSLSIGDPVFAVGNPLGLTGSLTSGVVSGVNRDIPLPGDEDVVLEDLIQFDAAINRGNSGGPLLNDQGHVVGIVTALADPAQQGFFIGIGFAVPIELAVGGAANGPDQ